VLLALPLGTHSHFVRFCELLELACVFHAQFNCTKWTICQSDINHMWLQLQVLHRTSRLQEDCLSAHWDEMAIRQRMRETISPTRRVGVKCAIAQRKQLNLSHRIAVQKLFNTTLQREVRKMKARSHLVYKSHFTSRWWLFSWDSQREMTCHVKQWLSFLSAIY